MENNFKQKAALPNPALEKFGVLIGDWTTQGSHPLVPGTTLQGKSSFQWLEGGAFLSWYSSIDHKDFPAGIAIIGSDDATGQLYMLYFDERKVSRKYDVSFKEDVLEWWRDAPGFFQHYMWTIRDDGNTIVGKGQLSKDGKKWKKDLDLTYIKKK